MVEIDIEYEGDLHCRAVHGPSGAGIVTDAPKDNQGKGEAFSPTDLLATSLGTCMMTIMGIYARTKGIDLTGTRVHVTKEMAVGPRRRVGTLNVTFHLPRHVAEESRRALERAAGSCPVRLSLSHDTAIEVTYRWDQ
jgi:putative redox protein